MRYDKVIHFKKGGTASVLVTKEERMLMKKITRRSFMAAMAVLAAGGLAGCAGSAGNGLEIIRIGHNQSTNHPTHTGLLAFQEFIMGQLGDKYDV